MRKGTAGGPWADIDAALKAGVIAGSDINYGQIVARGAREAGGRLKDWLAERLPDIWVTAYDASAGGGNEILEFSDGRYRYLFDYEWERVVVVFGISRSSNEKRDTARQSGFIPRFTHTYENMDRGHFMSHRQGGGMDVNFFPQNKEINRGWNDAGRIYRRMERYCASTPGVFCFARPLYGAGDTGWVPRSVEYGIVNGPTQYRVAVFPN